MSSTPNSSSRSRNSLFRCDCSLLLETVANQEAISNAQLDSENDEGGDFGHHSTTTTNLFGHPYPPHLKIHCYNKSTALLVAYTKHFAYVQLANSNNSSNGTTGGGTSSSSDNIDPPLEICRLVMFGDQEHQEDQDEGEQYTGLQREQPPQRQQQPADTTDTTISCVTTVLLEDDVHSWLGEEQDESKQQEEEGQGDNNDNKKFDVTVEDHDEEEKSTTTSSSLSTSKVLMKGVLLKTDDNKNERSSNANNTLLRSAVIIGTSNGKIYTVELLINNGKIINRNTDMYEVLPTTSDNNHHGSYHHHHYPFHPQGGVQSLTTYRNTGGGDANNYSNNSDDDESIYVWIVYGDGTLIKMNSIGFFPSLWHLGGKLGLSVDEILQLQHNQENENEHHHRGYHHHHKQPAKCCILRCHCWVSNNNSAAAAAAATAATTVTIIPLPRSFPSPFASLPREPWKVPHHGHLDDDESTTSSGSSSARDEEGDDNDDEDDDDMSNSTSIKTEIIEALTFGGSSSNSRSQQDPNNHNPTLTFYSSELQFGDSEDHRRQGTSSSLFSSQPPLPSSSFDNQGNRGEEDDNGEDNHIVGAVFDGTKAIVGGVFNVLKWSVGGGGGDRDNNMMIVDDDNTDGANAKNEDNNSENSDEDEQGASSSPDDNNNNNNKPIESSSHSNSKPNIGRPSSSSTLPFPSLWNNEPIRLYPCGNELHDIPRIIESCCIDPSEGKYAALTDNLGRVLLLDLSTKQIVRLWKGYRDATCTWFHSKKMVMLPNGHSSFRKKPPLHLAIYSKQRRVVDIWRVRPAFGSRIASMSVPDKCGALLGHSVGWPSCHLATAFVLSSRIPSGSQSHKNYIEQISIDTDEYDGTGSDPNTAANSTAYKTPTMRQIIPDSPQPSIYSTATMMSSSTSTKTPSREAALKLVHLRQLLSTASVSFTIEDVYKSLREITSLSDLATALDLLAQASVLDTKLGSSSGAGERGGSNFHKKVVSYCQEVLNAAIGSDGSVAVFSPRKGIPAAVSNPNVILLMGKIEYHSMLIQAYDVLHKFELSSAFDDDEASASQKSLKRNPSHWVLESVGWASLYEEVMNVDLDDDIPSFTVDGNNKVATFSQFASSCTLPTNSKEAQRLRIYFSHSSRVRREILGHVLKPLLADVFSYKVVYSILDSLAIREDVEYLLKCFGEWIMTLSVKEIYKKGLLTTQSPLQRFLQDMATKQLDSKGKNNTLEEGDIILDVLHSFCCQATDLVRAFTLAVLCREAAENATRRKEKLTYGKILTSRVVQDWDDILRKLRVCLLVSIRLKNTQLMAPISVNNVNEDGLFSVYEWLANDELRMSNTHEEILSMEIACKISSFAFDPSTSNGDGPSRFKQMKNSCLAVALDEDERAEYMIENDGEDEDDDRFGSLLLFFPGYNEPIMLVAHRARILSAKWCKEPSNMQILHNVVDSLSALHKCTDMSPLQLALCLDVWQTSICPIYRALLFSFDDVQEISEDIVEPLLRDENWLASVGQVALKILEMLGSMPWNENGAIILEAFCQTDDRKKADCWPVVRTADHILKRLIDKSRRIDKSALETHIAVVSALLVSKDNEALASCVPAIYECFLSDSLFNPIPQPPSDVTSLRFSFLEESILGKARTYDGPVMADRFDLLDIETLSKIWSYDANEARTIFLLAMYEVGKDQIVDDLLAKCTGQVNMHRFIEGGVDIACRRLHAFLNGREMQSPDMREAMGLLDADLCEWIKNRGRNSRPSTPVVPNYVSIGQTHLFALRLLSISASSGVDTELRVKVHSMVVLSGTLVKILEIKTGTASVRGESVG